jgi:cobalt-zinc-cadmium efflux system outer membrane protein
MKFFPFVLSILCALPGFAAEPKPAPAISLDALVSQTVANNPEVKFYEAELAAAKGERKAAGTWANPELSTEVGRKRVRGDVAAEGTAWTVSVQQTFEWPGRVSLRKAIADRQVKLAELGLEQFRASLAAEVRRRAFLLYAAQMRAAAAREGSTRGEELVATLVQREPAGVAPLLEMRAIEASVIKLRREASEAAHQAQTALFELNQLRGLPIATPLAIAEPSMDLVDIPSVGELMHRAARNNFTLRQREMELAQQGFKVRLSENEAWPSITVGPQISQERAGERETIAGVGLSLPLPLWNRNTGNIDAARARKLQAQTSLQLAHREVERKLREHAADYELHRKEMARWNPKVAEQLREAAALADRHYRLGAVPLPTYLEVQSSYLEALQAIYATQGDAMTALAELELLTGSKLIKP